MLYKAGGKRAGQGLMPYSEHLANQVARAMGIDAVIYGLAWWRGELCSTCELFNSKDVSFVPLYHAPPRQRLGRLGLDSALEFFYGISPQASTAFVSMLAFDSIIANKDRHFGNYGVLRANATGEVLGMAPLFDHNLSLFCDEPNSAFSVEQLVDAERRYASAFGSNLRGQIGEVLEPSLIEGLEALVDFEFELDDELLRYADDNPDASDAFARTRLDALGRFVRFVARDSIEAYRALVG